MNSLITIILVLLIVDTLLQIIFKPKHNRLACGIMAWAGRSPKSFNRDKFNILGIQNETRGVDSCGVSVDGEIYFGVDADKRFRDFVANEGYPTPRNIPVVIGHTRKSTVGSNNIDNAHPFGFGDSKKYGEEAYNFIGVHNGTIYNQKDLAEMFEIETTRPKVNSKNLNYTIDKIDSEILLESIYKSEKFKVLSQYNGAAAIVFYWVDQPDTIYAFHGASVKSLDSNEKTLYIERDLYCFQEHKNSLYISSQDHALRTIGATNDTLEEFEVNVVYKIKNGNFKTAKKYPVTRANQQHEKVYDYQKKRKNAVNNHGNGHLTNAYKQDKGGSEKVRTPFLKSNYVAISGLDSILDDVRCSPPSKKVYMEQLRYKRNGHCIDGVYVWITDFGFYFIGHDIADAETTFYRLFNKKFYNGDFVYNEVYLKDVDSKEYFIPFPENAGFRKNYADALKHFHYFVDGVKIISRLDFAQINEFLRNNKPFGVVALSNASCHPICEIKEKKFEVTPGIYLDGVLADGTICPLGSEKIYHIKKGECIGIELVDTAKHRVPFSNLDLIVSSITKFEDDMNNKPDSLEFESDKKKDNSKVIELPLTTKSKDAEEVKSLVNSLDNDVVEKIIDEMFLPVIEKFQVNKDRLEKYKNTEMGREAITLFNDFIAGASLLLQVEVTEY